MADHQTKLANAQAMSQAYQGGMDSYSGGTAVGGVGGSGGGGQGVITPSSSGALATSQQMPDVQAFSSDMANTTNNMGNAMASGYLGQASAWSNMYNNIGGSASQIGANMMGNMMGGGMFG